MKSFESNKGVVLLDEEVLWKEHDDEIFLYFENLVFLSPNLISPNP